MSQILVYHIIPSGNSPHTTRTPAHAILYFVFDARRERLLLCEKLRLVSSRMHHKLGIILFSLLCLALNTESKWFSSRFKVQQDHRFGAHNEESVPPDHKKIIPMARYIMHNTDWVSIATISTLPALKGFPFNNMKSFVDGAINHSTGIPYFYLTNLDFSGKDLQVNNACTILSSLEETDYCRKVNIDAEDPRCARLIISGAMKKIDPTTKEYAFAKGALFERHPSMANFPEDHGFFVAKMKIIQIAMVDWFGGAVYIPVKDYLAYNYTQAENLDMLRAHNDYYRITVQKF